MALQLSRRKFTVDEYERMGANGILDEDDRVELIDGKIVEMPPVGGPHIHCINRLNRLLVMAAGTSGVVQVQSPVRLGEHQEPQPDLALLRPPIVGAPEIVPVGEDVLLIIEVADTTLRFDRRIKMPRYARAGISEAWIVDLNGRRLLVYREATANGYRQTRTLGQGTTITPLALPGQSLSIDAILG